jgi:hypothetical protein
MNTHTLNFGLFQIYPEIMVGEIFEDIHFNLDLNTVVCNLARSYFGNDTDFGYISHRKHNYSIDPMVHHMNKEFRNLKCFAIVDPNGIRPSATIESKFFFQDKFKSFYKLEDAIAWVHSVLRTGDNR